MNLYLVTCSRKAPKSLPNLATSDMDVYVIAPDAAKAEDAALLKLNRLGNFERYYANNIQFLADEEESSNGLLTIAEEKLLKGEK